MTRETFETLGIIVFRTLCLGCLVIGALASIVFAATAVLFPGRSMAMDIFACAMALLIAYAGKRGFAMRSRGDFDRDAAEFRERREKLERWINKA